jgi:hypothetical protein
MLYNSMLRGFGNCGEVSASEDVEYASERFWQLLAMRTVASRMEAAGQPICIDDACASEWHQEAPDHHRRRSRNVCLLGPR